MRRAKTPPPPIPPIAERRRPGLSETLPREFDAPWRCRACGDGHHVDFPLTRYREHDPEDRPTRRIVVLCARCSARLIDAHARLYSALDAGVPTPGCMGVCSACAYRDGTRCTSPDVAVLTFRWDDEPVHAFICGGPLAGARVFYPSPVRACSGARALAVLDSMTRDSASATRSTTRSTTPPDASGPIRREDQICE